MKKTKIPQKTKGSQAPATSSTSVMELDTSSKGTSSFAVEVQPTAASIIASIHSTMARYTQGPKEGDLQSVDSRIGMPQASLELGAALNRTLALSSEGARLEVFPELWKAISYKVNWALYAPVAYAYASALEERARADSNPEDLATAAALYTKVAGASSSDPAVNEANAVIVRLSHSKVERFLTEVLNEPEKGGTLPSAVSNAANPESALAGLAHLVAFHVHCYNSCFIRAAESLGNVTYCKGCRQIFSALKLSPKWGSVARLGKLGRGVTGAYLYWRRDSKSVSATPTSLQPASL